MLDSFLISVLVGTALGFLTGLGTGGGSLLLLWLTLVMGMDAPKARVLNLMFFLPAALISTVVRLRKGGISLGKLLLPASLGCIAAALFALLGRSIDTTLLRKLFGILLLFTGLRELFYRPRKPK